MLALVKCGREKRSLGFGIESPICVASGFNWSRLEDNFELKSGLIRQVFQETIVSDFHPKFAKFCSFFPIDNPVKILLK